MGDPDVTAIITSYNNREILEKQLDMIFDEAEKVIVVVNGSTDDSLQLVTEYADSPNLHVILHDNNGAGPGRNAGLRHWDTSTPYVLLVDGGVLPARGITKAMKDYLERHPEVDVVSPEIASCFTTDWDEADLIFNKEIPDKGAFQQRMLSSTACALCRPSAFEKVMFSEEGPYGEPGWGVDDNDMQMRWNKAGVVHIDFPGVKLYRRASGSFQSLYDETGIWPNQYGSVYERRLVKYYQDWAGNGYVEKPLISCVLLAWNEYPMVARAVKSCHDQLKGIPHEVIVVDNGSTDGLKWWLDTFEHTWHGTDTKVTKDHHILRMVDGMVKEMLWDRQEKKHIEIGERPDLVPVWSGNVRRIDMAQNVGTGEGFNIGMSQARGDYIFYLAGDILPVDGTIVAMKDELEQNDDMDYVCINAWVCQDETDQVEFNGFPVRQGLGNYAYSYAMIKRHVWDAGVRFADQGPFAGAGCGYEEIEFAYLMAEKGFKGWMHNGVGDPNHKGYYHHRRDFERTGHDELELQNILAERRAWLQVRWNNARFDITHYHDQPPDKSVRRLAIINKAAPGHPGPANFLYNAAKDICHTELFEPSSVPDGFDYYLFVDDGDWDAYTCPEHAHPSAFWAIDFIYPHQHWRLHPDKYIERLRTFDKAFVAQQSALDYCAQNGLTAKWIPLAADPDHHRYIPYAEKEHNWVGIWHHVPERVVFAEAVDSAIRGFIAYADDKKYAEFMAKGRCAVNYSRSGEINMRVFEVMSMGVPLVTDRTVDLPRLFEENEHYIGYSDPLEAAVKIKWVVDNLGEANAMAQRARSLVLEKHTYYHRLLSMFFE